MYEKLFTLKKSHWLLILSKIYFLEIPNFIKLNSPKIYALEEIDYFFIKTLWIYFKYNGLLHTLSVCNIHRKKNQVLDFWVTNKIAFYLEYAPVILHNYKKLNMAKLLRSISFSI